MLVGPQVGIELGTAVNWLKMTTSYGRAIGYWWRMTYLFGNIRIQARSVSRRAVSIVWSNIEGLIQKFSARGKITLR